MVRFAEPDEAETSEIPARNPVSAMPVILWRSPCDSRGRVVLRSCEAQERLLLPPTRKLKVVTDNSARGTPELRETSSSHPARCSGSRTVIVLLICSECNSCFEGHQGRMICSSHGFRQSRMSDAQDGFRFENPRSESRWPHRRALSVKLNTEEPDFNWRIISRDMPAMQLPEARSCLEHGLRRHVRRLRVRGRGVTLRLSPALASHHRPMR